MRDSLVFVGVVAALLNDCSHSKLLNRMSPLSARRVMIGELQCTCERNRNLCDSLSLSLDRVWLNNSQN